MVQLKQIRASGSRQIIRVNVAGAGTEVNPNMLIATSGSPQTIGTGLGSVNPAARNASSVDLQTSRSQSSSVVSGANGFGACADNAIGGSASSGFGERNSTGAVRCFVSGKEASNQYTHALVFSAGSFSGAHSAASAQTMRWVQRRTTTDGTTVSLNSPSLFTPPSSSILLYSILVTAYSTGGNAAAFRLEGGIKRPAFTTSLIGSVSKTVLAKDLMAMGWDVNISTNGTDLLINVTGALSTTINWSAFIKTVEVK